MVTKETILEAYIFLRENNNTIPDETLDFIKRVCMDEIDKKNGIGGRDNYSLEDLIRFGYYVRKHPSIAMRKNYINYKNKAKNL